MNNVLNDTVGAGVGQCKAPFLQLTGETEENDQEIAKRAGRDIRMLNMIQQTLHS